jgi:hypothetical protein
MGIERSTRGMGHKTLQKENKKADRGKKSYHPIRACKIQKKREKGTRHLPRD